MGKRQQSVVELRYEANRCYLRATRSNDVQEIEALQALGAELSAKADRLEKEESSRGRKPDGDPGGDKTG